MRLRVSIRDLLWLTLVFACGCSAKPQPVADPLPSLAEIDTMDASFLDPATGKEIKLHVPQANWKMIFAALRPVGLDTSPEKCLVLCDLVLTRKSAGTLWLGLLENSDGSVAFSIGNNYYRGGNSDKLMQALRLAKAESH
jgi:hypothetical protein